MPRTDPAAELAYYDAIRGLDLPREQVVSAVNFSRCFADLAGRAVAAICAQQGREVELPPLLALPALKAWTAGSGFSAAFSAAAPQSWGRETSGMLCGLCEWLAAAYTPGQPVSGSFQVWVGQPGKSAVTLFGPPTSQQPPPPFTLAETPPIAEYIADSAGRPNALIGHYDVHGLSMIALTRRFLLGLGADDIDDALSFEWTGDISKLWKRAVPKTVQSEREYAAVVLIDCSVHSRKPEYTRKAVARLENAPATRLLIVDHHDDTLQATPGLIEGGAEVVLTDVLSCGLTGAYGNEELELMYLGALGDKVPEILSISDKQALDRLSNANTQFHRWMINFSPTPKPLKDAGIYPMRPLWEELAMGTKIDSSLTIDTLGTLSQPEPPPLPDIKLADNLLVVTSKLTTVGRTWYSLLEQLMEREGCAYAAAMRILDGRRANILLLNHWQKIEYPPIISFVPEEYLSRCLGHPSAVWADLEVNAAITYIDSVARNLNSYLGEEQGLGEIAADLDHNIIRAS